MGTAFPVLDKPQGNTGGTEITMTFNMMSMKIALAGQKRPGLKSSGGGRYACPDPAHKGAVAFVTEQLVCEDGHANERGDMLAARELEDGTAVLVDGDHAEAAKTGGMKKKEIELVAVRRAQLDAFTRRDEGANRVRFNKEFSTQDLRMYAMFLGAATDPEVALVGALRLRSRKVYVLEMWNGQLVLQPLILTPDLAPPDDLSGELAPVADEIPKLQAKVKELLGALVVEFDAEAFHHDKTAALDELAAAVASGDAPPAVAATPADSSVDDLMAMMDTVISTAKPAEKKAPAKKKAASAA